MSRSPTHSRARSLHRLVALFGAFAVLAALTAASAPGAGQIEGVHKEPLANLDARTGGVAPSFEQIQMVSDLGADVVWNRFGTPSSLFKQGGFLADGVGGDTAVSAALGWIDANKALFRLSSVDGLTLHGDSRMPQSNGHAVHFKQTFAGLPAAQDGLITVGLTGTPESGWKVAYVSSSAAGDAELAGSTALSPQEAWVRAAANVGRAVSLVNLGAAKTDREWTVFAVRGFAQAQRARPVAVPTPTGGVRPAFETLVVDVQGGAATGYKHLVDAESGAILVRENLVHQSHPAADVFTGDMTGVANGDCRTPDHGPWTVGANESVASVGVIVSATLETNDSVIHLLRDGTIVASQDTLFSPEVIHYAPSGGVPAGDYTVRVCDYGGDGAVWDQPASYQGSIVFNSLAPGGVPYPPKWKVFPAYPLPPSLAGYPWNISSDDIRKLWCWDSVVQGSPVSGCDDEVGNLAARVPWDYDVNAGAPTFTTRGNQAISAESWFSPLTPGPTGFRPTDLNRDYSFGWTNEWYESTLVPMQPKGCTSEFVTGVSTDISAAVTNLFAMHNRMHDWSYFLGFTEENWNAQQDNFGNAGAENDPILGDAQAGAANGGYPGYLGRDNANMITLPDGVPSITNMYLWQPLKGAFYAPCVDGDYDMSVIGHEYGHMIENRMIGKGGNRSGHHAGAMGESSGDLIGMEVTNEFGFVPVSDENRFAVGAYVTGNKQRGIRNYGMNQSPLNFSNMGYDAFAASPVHADGEIWSAVNFDIRQALVEKYNATHPESDATLQRRCADGLGNTVTAPTPPEHCPGNRRWIQLMFDAYLLMPTAPSMLQARDAYLAADQMRFGGANQSELWLAFARRGFGVGATSSNGNVNSDTDPKPDFASPLHPNATVTFSTFAPDEANAPITNARIFVGHYEARTSPIADTNPATSTSGTNNLDDTAQFAPGTYEFLVRAPGYGYVKFTRTFAAGQTVTLNIAMHTNWASSAKGATASGDFSPAGSVIDDTEGTNATATAMPPATTVNGRQVTVALGAAKTVSRVQVSTSLNAQNRFTALRQFQIEVSTNGLTFAPVFTSPADAFPGVSPRPALPDMITRSFDLPAPVQATHVRLVALTNQCTGQADFQGTQDNDPLNATDCRTNQEDIPDPPASFAPRDNAVVVAELQVFSGGGGNGNGNGVTPGATLTLSPESATNVVGTQHCVTGTLVDAAGKPIRNTPVRFSVSGANTASGSQNTNNQGKATFCYTGTNDGIDLISAYGDLNKDGVQQGDEPADTASKTWVPQSTPSCEVKISNGGEITTIPMGNRATFGGNAKASASGVPSGNQQYQDHGPPSMNVKSLNVQAIECPDESSASIFGQASIDGSGSVDYRIDVTDAGEPGTDDTYRIRLGPSGAFYDSGPNNKLKSGNVQINRK